MKWLVFLKACMVIMAIVEGARCMFGSRSLVTISARIWKDLIARSKSHQNKCPSIDAMSVAV